jgi:hypothetical protein
MPTASLLPVLRPPSPQQQDAAVSYTVNSKQPTTMISWSTAAVNLPLLSFRSCCLPKPAQASHQSVSRISSSVPRLSLSRVRLSFWDGCPPMHQVSEYEDDSRPKEFHNSSGKQFSNSAK